jgi:hypothetical protein
VPPNLQTLVSIFSTPQARKIFFALFQDMPRRKNRCGLDIKHHHDKHGKHRTNRLNPKLFKEEIP